MKGTVSIPAKEKETKPGSPALSAREAITYFSPMEDREADRAPLKAVLEHAGLKAGARYIAFYCADSLEVALDGTGQYYETIDLIDATHPQTILAYDMNDRPLDIAHGAPLRLRLERQLGYKMAKYIMRIELVADFSQIGDGKGGYWEDQGYEWWAGI